MTNLCRKSGTIKWARNGWEFMQFRIPLLSQLDLRWHWRKLLMIWGREKSVYVQSPCKLKRNCTLILLIPCTVSNPFLFLIFNLLFNFSPQWSKIDFWSWTLVFKMWSPIRFDVTFFPFETWKDFNSHVSLFLLQLSFPKFQLHLWGIWVMEEQRKTWIMEERERKKT